MENSNNNKAINTTADAGEASVARRQIQAAAVTKANKTAIKLIEIRLESLDLKVPHYTQQQIRQELN